MTKSTPFPIDAVITWVDGDDPELSKKREAYSTKTQKLGDINSATRYKSLNEILYCVGSILKFAPFFRHIFIVTDNQTPPIFERLENRFGSKAQKIKIVDHHEIFRGYEHHLPVFNSSSIETMLFRIPDLSEHWVYFNDDFFILGVVNEARFFTDGMPVLRAKLTSVDALVPKTSRLGFINNRRLRKAKYLRQIHLARANTLAGLEKKVIQMEHAPYSFRKSTAKKFVLENKDIVEKVMAHKFRDPEQYSTPTLLGALEYSNNNRNLRVNDFIYLKPAGQRRSKRLSYIKSRLETIQNSQHLKFACIQSLDMVEPECKEFVLDWLENWIFQD